MTRCSAGTCFLAAPTSSGDAALRALRPLHSREAVAQSRRFRPVVSRELPDAAELLGVACDREQPFLLPPDVREWLPEDHLAWFVIDAVDVMDLSAFYAAYRDDGHGRAAYEPSMMVALLLYCWSRGTRSSRRIERACVEDVACRIVAAHQQPDHATIARFVERHETALADLFGQVLTLCAEAGMATVGVIAIDGTKVAANASRDRTMTYEQIAQAIVAEAIETDAAETARHGDRRGDELRRSSRPTRAAAAGYAPPPSASSSSAPSRPGRSRGHASSGCRTAADAWKKSSRSSATPTRAMRPTGRAGG